MFSASQIALSFDHQYLRKELSNLLGFLNEDNHQRDVASQTTSFGWVQPVVPLVQPDCWIL